MGLPVGGPTTLPMVRAALKLRPDDTDDDAELASVVGAVNYLVRRWPVSAQAVATPVAEDWPDSIARGATMLATRLWRRKDSPAGVESFGQLGAAYVMRSDPDIAMLLKLGSWQAPGLG